MQGPRPVEPAEMPSLGALVDVVFDASQPTMSDMFPTLFCEANRENLLVYADGDRIVSHVGMTERWASLGDCLAGVACIGAVATYEEYRGRGLATALLEQACAKAQADGMDFMLISGGRGLYRRTGAADIGRDCKAVVNDEVAATLHRTGVVVADFDPAELDYCSAVYAMKRGHFVRPAEDWTGFLERGYCACSEARIEVVREREIFCGYVVPGRVNDEGILEILEFAGEETTIAAAIGPLLYKYKAKAAKFHLQPANGCLRTVFAGAGAACTPANGTGTCLLLDFPRLMERLHPYFEARIGREAAKALSFSQDGEVFRFVHGNDELVVEGKAAAAQVIFGAHEREAEQGMFGRLFPVPGLCYGLNYI